MGLRQQVRPGSFRGVPFMTVSSETDGLARRVEVHQFPFRNTPFAEDFGEQARSFSLEVYVPWERPPGAEKGGRRDLQEACAAAGPGPLMHPFWGERTVVCTRASASENNGHIGLTRFTLEFTDAGNNRFPDVEVNTTGAVEESGQEARVALQESFSSRWPRIAPQWVTDASVARIQDLAGALESARALVPGGVSPAAFKQVLQELADPTSLLSNPGLLGGAISSTIQSLAGLSTDPFSTFRMLSGFVQEFGSAFASIDASPGSSRFIEAERQESIIRLAKGSAVVEAAVAVREVPLSSYNDAATMRDRVVELFDSELEATGDLGDDVALEALTALRTEVLNDLRVRGAALATVRTLTLASTTPAIVLAYRLYTDPERGEEIVARNGLRHPIFLPAAVPLEVLSA